MKPKLFNWPDYRCDETVWLLVPRFIDCKSWRRIDQTSHHEILKSKIEVQSTATGVRVVYITEDTDECFVTHNIDGCFLTYKEAKIAKAVWKKIQGAEYHKAMKVLKRAYISKYGHQD